jgi:hypothetical protein
MALLVLQVRRDRPVQLVQLDQMELLAQRVRKDHQESLEQQVRRVLRVSME